jgi:pilus assembly protein CpaE
MNRVQQTEETLQVALLTVGLEQDDVYRIREAASDKPWTILPADFENYFSAVKRPHLQSETLGCGAAIAVIDLDGDADAALETAEFLLQVFSHKIAMIGLSTSMQSELLLRAMRAGCCEVLSKPLDPSHLASALSRLEQRWSNTLARPQKSGKILSFFGAKGGVGTTTLAVHLAIYLASVCKKKVILIDSHAQLGHVCLYLGLDGNRYHFDELIRNVNRLDQDLLRGFTAKHGSGVDVLSSPDVLSDRQTPSTSSIRQTLEFLSVAYDFVLLDCELPFDEITFTAVSLSTYAYLVTGPELTSIRDLSRCVDRLIQHDQPTEKLQVVINRYSPRQALSIEQIEKAVRLPVSITIGNHYRDLTQFITMGEPVAPDQKSEFASQVLRWATSLCGTREAASLPAPRKRFALWS